MCRGGIVFLPGAAGTVQEIFQSGVHELLQRAGPGGSDGARGPGLLDPHQLPVWPLLEALGRGRPFGSRLHLVDEPDEVLALLLADHGRT